MNDISFERPVFVFPRVFKELLYEGCDYSLGAGYIRAFLGSRGIPSEQYIDGGDGTLSEVAAGIIARAPSVVGFTCYDGNFFYVKLLAEEIRRLAPRVIIVCGGPTATFSDDLILSACSAIDVVVRGYGEETTLELLQALSRGLPLGSISGITFRDGTGGLHRTPSRVPKALSEPSHESAESASAARSHLEPPPVLDDYPDPYVYGYIPVERISDIGTVTSRGCAFACTFCNFAAMSSRKAFFQSVSSVLRIFRFLDGSFTGSQSKRLVTINDDNFSMHRQRFHDLLRAMADENFANIEFWAEMRVEPLEDFSFDLLRAAGFREINFGLESAVPRVLANAKKVRLGGGGRDDFAKEREYVRKIAHSVRRLGEVGIKSCVSVIFGLPGETAEDGESTLRFVEEVGVDRYAHNYITVRLGTELANSYAQHGMTTFTVPGRSLPLITRAAYDVGKLRVLDIDESQLPLQDILLQDATLLLSGMGFFSGRNRRVRDSGRGGAGVEVPRSRAGDPLAVPHFLLARLGEDQSNTLGWLGREKPMASMVWARQEVGDYAEIEGHLALAGVAVPEAMWMRELPVGGGRAIEVGGPALAEARSVVRLVEVPPGAPIGEAAPVNARGEAHFVEFESLKDLEDFARSFSSDEDRILWRLPRAALERRLFVKDGCRWCSQTCPAERGVRWQIDGAHVRACDNGAPLGRVDLGVTLGELNDRAFERRGIVAKTRGCSSCPAISYCSQCPDTAPFTIDAFCAIKRQGRRLSDLLDGLVLGHSVVNRLSVGDREDYYVVQSLSGVGGVVRTSDRELPLSSCLVFAAQSLQVAYLHNARVNHTVGLTTRAAEILVHLAKAQSV